MWLKFDGLEFLIHMQIHAKDNASNNVRGCQNWHLIPGHISWQMSARSLACPSALHHDIDSVYTSLNAVRKN